MSDLHDGGFDMPLTMKTQMSTAALVTELIDTLAKGFSLKGTGEDKQNFKDIMAELNYRFVVKPQMKTKVVSPPVKDEYQNTFVHEYIGDDFQCLKDRAHDSDYWRSCHDFVDENFNRKLTDMTFKQREWLEKIKTALNE